MLVRPGKPLRVKASCPCKMCRINSVKFLRLLDMKLSDSDKQQLLGPAVMGVLLGAFVAFVVLGFESEYHPEASSWEIGTQAVLGFLLSVAGVIAAFGVVPVILNRRMKKDKPDI